MKRLVFVAFLAAVTSPLLALAQTGGPNTFGYSYAPSAFDYVPPPGTASALTTSLGIFADDGEAVVALPWAFPFFGSDYSTIYVSDNGGIRFTFGDVDFSNYCLPSTGGSTPHLQPMWEDLDPVSGGAIYAWEDAGDGRFVISWEQILHYGPSPQGATFQVHLEPEGGIEFHWADTSFGESAFDGGAASTIGIQDPAAADPLQFSCMSPEAVAGTATRFTSCTDADGDGDEAESCGGGDCDDSDPTVASTALELCGDSLDQDCDGSDITVDIDGDGFLSALACANGEDCNDNNAAINPSVDADGDGANLCIDCNDNPGIGAFLFPGNTEVCGDGIDQDCSGTDDIADVDGDGYNSPACQGIDCDDTDAGLSPGIDGDADGFSSCDDCDDSDGSLGSNADDDGDGSPNCYDCASADPAIYLGAAESCDSIDTDCDGLADGQDSDIGLPAQAPQDFGPGAGGFFPDFFFGGPLVDTITVTGGPTTILDLDFAFSAGYLLGNANTTLADFQLTSPAGTTITLVQGVGSTVGVGFFGTLLDDEATDPLSSGTDPFAGDYQPIDPLSAFDGENSNGTWTLTADGDPAGFGEVTGWNLIFPGSDPDDSDGDGWNDNCGDCDGSDATIFPDAPELCGDGIDQDCSGADAPGDLDNDGYLDDVCGGPDCDPNDPAVNPSVDGDGDGSDICLDCDDADNTLVPGNTEICGDGLDQNCDGIDQPTDADADGYIDEVCGGDDCDSTDPLVNPGADQDGDGSQACLDCEDTDPDVFPEALDVCNGQDEDCDGISDNRDADGDGSLGCGGGDCDDNEALAHPEMEEICDDGIDNDCAGGEIVGDADGDGHQTWACGGGDCDDNFEDIYPGAAEPCDGIDHDCDGISTLTDLDLDTWGDAACGGPDCDDTMASVHPGVGELCNGLDDNCDGEFAPPGEIDADGDGAWACQDCEDDDPGIFEDSEELCDGIDNDCDGDIDDGVITDGDGDGHLRESCGGDDCIDGSDIVFPGATEGCSDDVDNDCDGAVDLDDEDCASLRSSCNCEVGAGSQAGGWVGALMAAAVLRRRRRGN